MKRRLLFNAAAAISSIFLAIAIFGLPIGHPYGKPAIVQAQICEEEALCVVMTNTTCNDDPCAGIWFASMQTQYVNGAAEFKRPRVFGTGYSTWHQGNQVVCYEYRNCVQSTQLLCDEDDSYPKIVNGTGPFLNKYTDYPLNGNSGC